MTKMFDSRYIDDLRANNYFGCMSTGQNLETQLSIQSRWLDAMAQRGWILDESIIEEFSHDPAHETIDMTSKLESDALASLTQVCA
jgi:hypothetical protein